MKKQFSEAKKSKTNIEFMWIDKYKPTCKEEVLGNNKLVISLKKWLDPNKKNSKKSRKSEFLPYSIIFKITFIFCIYNFKCHH